MTLFIVLTALFIYVLATNEITRLHRTYLVFHFLMMLWPFFIYLVNITSNLGLEWVFLKIAFFGMSFASFAWLNFSMYLTGWIDHVKKRTVWLAALPAVFSATIAIVNPGYLFVSIGERGWVDRLFGPLFWVLIIIQVLYAFTAVGLTMRTWEKTQNKMFKEQLSVCIIGCIFFYGFAVADILINVVINSKTVVPALTSMGTVLAMVCFIVAITNYDLVKIVSIARREIIDNMAIGIVVLSNENIIVGHNPSASRFFELESGQVFNLNQLLESMDDQDIRHNFMQTYKSGEFQSLQAEVTLGNSLKRRVLINVGKIEVNGKKVLGRTISLTDITELNNLLDEIGQKNIILKQQNEELIKVQEELFRMEQSRRNLLSNISHDLRSPMTLIQGYLQAIIEGIIDEPVQQNKYLKMIYSKAVLLTRLIDDLFHLSQLESRQVSYEFSLVPADQLVAKFYGDCQLETISAGTNVVLQIQPFGTSSNLPYPMVNVDADRLEQVFVNLMSNAIKHMRDNGEITISLEPVSEGLSCEEVLIAVKDNGAGIIEEDIPYVFDRFYKGRDTGRADSYGIGLAIAKEIVTIHNGQIWVESQIGQGSTFYIKLPVISSASA